MRILKYILPILMLMPSMGNSGNFGEPIVDGNWFRELGIKSAKIAIGDNVINGCWTNLKEVREYTEEKLRGIGLRVIDPITDPDVLPDIIFFVAAVGGKNFGHCMGSAETSMYSQHLQSGRDVLIMINSRNVNFFGHSKKFNDEIINLVSEMFR